MKRIQSFDVHLWKTSNLQEVTKYRPIVLSPFESCRWLKKRKEHQELGQRKNNLSRASVGWLRVLDSPFSLFLFRLTFFRLLGFQDTDKTREADRPARPSERVRFSVTRWGIRVDICVYIYVYNNMKKAAPHVPHYDFSALLLIKMQIYRAREARDREVRRITSGGATTNTGIWLIQRNPILLHYGQWRTHHYRQLGLRMLFLSCIDIC